MTTLTVELPEQLGADLERMSSEAHQDIQDIVRESIRRYVATEEFRALRRKTLAYAQAQGFFTDEDVFRIAS